MNLHSFSRHPFKFTFCGVDISHRGCQKRMRARTTRNPPSVCEEGAKYVIRLWRRRYRFVTLRDDVSAIYLWISVHIKRISKERTCLIVPFVYRGVNKGLYVLLSRTQIGPGRTVKQEQEEISCDHVQLFTSLYISNEKVYRVCPL